MGKDESWEELHLLIRLRVFRKFGGTGTMAGNLSHTLSSLPRRLGGERRQAYVYVDMQDAERSNMREQSLKSTCKETRERQTPTHETGYWDDFFFRRLSIWKPDKNNLERDPHDCPLLFVPASGAVISTGLGLKYWTCIRGFGNAMQLICKQQYPWDRILPEAENGAAKMSGGKTPKRWFGCPFSTSSLQLANRFAEAYMKTV